MNFGSLFSGIGGLDLGVEHATGWRCAWQVEADPFCREVLAKHWPHVPKHDDVRTFDATAFDAVDIIVGGFPCQDVSVAGLGAGLAGERSGLWFEFLRIIRAARPRGVIVENVPGLVRRGLDEVVAGLAGEGYAVEATNLGAEDVGAPHRRRRLFLVAYADGERRMESQRPLCDLGRRSADGGCGVGDSVCSRREGRGTSALAGRPSSARPARRRRARANHLGPGAEPKGALGRRLATRSCRSALPSPREDSRIDCVPTHPDGRDLHPSR